MPLRRCSGPLLGRALFVGMLATALAYGQAAPKPVARKTVSHRTNELTLAGLRPGLDALEKAVEVNKPFGEKKKPQDDQTAWYDACRNLWLAIDGDKAKKIVVIRVAHKPIQLPPEGGSLGDCGPMPPSPWKTGHGLRVWDSASRVLKLYGEPDSRSPSTKEGQPLELWYYAFDWAGADVPQVMEVLCTREAEGKPGRVVEITLAGPSL
jgi:hypothetical protein